MLIYTSVSPCNDRIFIPMEAVNLVLLPGCDDQLRNGERLHLEQKIYRARGHVRCQLDFLLPYPWCAETRRAVKLKFLVFSAKPRWSGSICSCWWSHLFNECLNLVATRAGATLLLFNSLARVSGK